ncbi:MAG: alanine racemase, partial [Thiohalobacterales bacterium]|nr:alanine racemase [Thiohalobacterales bacterium]
MTRPARACIDLHALRHNFQRVRQAAPDSRVMAIIKANAYGHGLLRVAQSLPDADAFGIVTPEEGIVLREAGFDHRIVLLEGIFSPDDISLVNAYRLDTVIHHESQIAMLEQAVLSRPHDVWLKVDTGMNRLGFRPEDTADAVARLRAIEGVAGLRFMTHFARADEIDNAATATQQALFEDAVDTLPGERTLANSAAILAWPGTRADWVRPGIMLYGASPLPGKAADALDLQPVMTLKSRLIAIKDCRKGDT